MSPNSAQQAGGDSFLFDLDDVDSRSSQLLGVALGRIPVQIYVEFLQYGGYKPHAVLHLNLNEPIAHSLGNIVACRLSMEYERADFEGTFRIKLLKYNRSSISAHAAFQFPLLNTNLAIYDYVQIIRGRGGIQGDLTGFNFIEANPATGSLDGCRDFISQAFIRLHKLGIVGWTAEGISAGEFTRHSQSLPSPLDFHSLIGNNYVLERGQSSRLSGPSRGVSDHGGYFFTTIIPLLVHRGEFHDERGVQRVEVYQNWQLPYIPDPSRS